MEGAIREARAAALEGEVPVGAVAVRDGMIIAAARNHMEQVEDATAHAEMAVLRSAAKVVGNWRLEGVTVYVTLEPCPMCAGAMVQARIDRCVYGARDPKKGADGSVYEVLRNPANNHIPEVAEGVLGEECGGLLSDFFASVRKGRKQQA
jgi:tRNA(Arg) A34 adenosine deaminase TadA